MQKTLDRKCWHKPLISIVITHHNYSHQIRDALLSLLDQTHEYWECVIVDDASSPEHQERLKEIIEELNEPRISIRWLADNVGQIPTFFAGLEVTKGEFVCLLDPDDRYAETFLEEAVKAHLNPSIICSIVCTDQYLFGEHGVIAGGNVRHWQVQLKQGDVNPGATDLAFIPYYIHGWHWTSTSSMMFRRPALRYLRPVKKLAYQGAADAYLASGAHRLGGTLFVKKPLVYRQLHTENCWIGMEIVSSFCNHKKPDVEEWGGVCKADSLEALIANGAFLPPLPSEFMKMRKLLTKWKRSFMKRFHKIYNLVHAP